MIGKLSGKIDRIFQNSLIIDVGGVGYKVATPTNILVKYGSTGKKVALFIHTYVREDTIALFGFEHLEELALFEKLISIAGIGAKIALAVISAGSTEQIRKAVLNADVDFFTSISGIGDKSARRLIVDLRGVFEEDAKFDILDPVSPAYEEALQALTTFGFTQREARKALRSVKKTRTTTAEELLEKTLKRLGGQKK